MNQMISNLGFRVMAWMLRRRDNPEFTGPILSEAGISRGMTVLDFGCDTGLADASINVALQCDVFHMLKKKGRVLAEIYRVLKADGILSFSDHHLREDMIIAPLTAGGKFKLVSRGAKTYSFAKTNPIIQNDGESIREEEK